MLASAGPPFVRLTGDALSALGHGKMTGDDRPVGVNVVNASGMKVSAASGA